MGDTLAPSDFDEQLIVPGSDLADNSMGLTQGVSLTPQSAWFITLADGTTCHKESGQVNIAYGNQGDIYDCDDIGIYSAVTKGSVNDGKYYYECKLTGATYFRSCFAKEVVY